MNEDEGADLLRRAREREPEAVAALCEQFYPKLLKYMHYRVRADVAEDLAGEVLVRVLRGLDGQNGSFPAWLYRIAANVVIDHARAAKTRRAGPMDDRALQEPLGATDVSATVARQIDLREALARLTNGQRELVTLKFIQGLSNTEVGEVTGRKPEAVRALQFRALRALRGLLGDPRDE